MDMFLDSSLCARWFGGAACRVVVRATRIRTGLEAQAVHLVSATARDRQGQSIQHRFVRKVLCGASAREAAVYQRLVTSHVPSLAPRLLRVTRPARRSAILYLEQIAGAPRWPWADLEASASVLERIARLHELRCTVDVPAWDYEAELAASAASTVAMAHELAASPARELVRTWVPLIEDVASQLHGLRRHLRGARPFAGCILHGDLHTGNVLLRTRGGTREPVFVDWARARRGSALEDVSSWLQSGSTWEPEIRRRHDSLLVRYLVARGLAPRLTGELRDLYWFAAASNALAGALAYHFAVLSKPPAYDPGSPSARSARDWLRALRQARARL